MTSDLCPEDVVVRITTPQMLSAEGGGAGAAGAGVSAGTAGSRVAASSAAVELGRRLLLAARAGDTAQVLELMARGAPFSTDWLGTSALHLAAAHAHADTCAVLLRAGVSRDARTKVERTPLHVAAAAGHAKVARLLLDAGAAVDCRDMLRMTPLHWAVQRGHAAAAAELLARGADPAAASKFHKTPRHIAQDTRRPDLLRLLDDALREREAARSVRHLTEQMAEEPPAEPQLQAFDAVRRIQDVKPPKVKQQPDRVVKTESKPETTSTSGANASSNESGAAARLLRAHGITLLPADHSTTVLNALHSGRTVVLSDAGKLMLKESGEAGAAPPAAGVVGTAPAGVAGAAPAAGAGAAPKSVVLTATPVKSPPRAGVKIFTLNNKLLALPKDKLPANKILNPQDMQVKFVQLPADAKIISPAKAGGARRPGVKIIMNKSNFNRLVAGATPPATPAPDRAAPAPKPLIEPLQPLEQLEPLDELKHEHEPEHDHEHARALESDESSDVGTLRAQLAASRRALAGLRAELRTAQARLAAYEAQHHT